MNNHYPFNIENYHKEFSKYPKCLMESEGRVYGAFFIGNYYKRANGYYGEYPPSYMKRMKALFPDRSPTLHLFGGTVKAKKIGEVTVDINPKLKPDICCSVMDVPQWFRRNTFDIVYADPPYSNPDAQRYGYPMPNKKMVLRAARKVVKEGAILVWLDTKVPIFRKIEWNMVGMITIFTGTNRILRAATIFEASTDKYYDENYK